MDAGVADDYEDDVRPQQTVPDFGADESPFALPTISLIDASSAEGNSGTSVLPIHALLSTAHGITTTVDFTLTAGTATGGDDYSALASGMLVFVPGQITATIEITLIGDGVVEVGRNGHRQSRQSNIGDDWRRKLAR